MNNGLFSVLLGKEGGDLVDGVFLLKGNFVEHEKVHKELNKIVFGLVFVDGEVLVV